MEQFAVRENVISTIRPVADIVPFRRNDIDRSNVNPSAVISDHASRPIKDREQLEQFKKIILSETGKYSLRNYAIFLLGINCGLRCGDVLQIRLQDLWDEEKQEVKSCRILEEKTGKVRNVSFSDTVANDLRDYILTISNRTPYTPLFPSQKKGSHADTDKRRKDNTGCLDRRSYWRILNSVAKLCNLEHIGTHTMRKTFGYNVYTMFDGELIAGKYSALDVTQHMLNHSSSKDTLRYIGIDMEVEEAVYKNMNL